MNAASILEIAAQELPKGRALIYNDGESISYEELNYFANRIGNGLKSLGVGRGDKVAIMLNNSMEWVAIWFGLTKIGAVLVPIGAFYKSEELGYILKHAEVNTVFIEGQLSNLLKEVSSPFLKNIIIVGEKEEEQKDLISFKQLTQGRDSELETIDTKPEELFAIWYTSGTTRFPKGVMMDHYGFGSHTAIVPESIMSTPNDIMLSGVPCSSIVSKVTIFGMVASKTPTVMLPRFSAEKALELMQSQKVTIFYGVPTMVLYAINELEKDTSSFNLDSLRLIIASAAPQAEKDVERLMELLPNVAYLRFYGATETTGGMANTHISDYRLFGYQPDSVGRAVRGSDIKIIDEEGNEVSVGEQGELIWRGTGLMKGYLKEPELTEKVIKNGYYHTGDLAKRDELGMYYITGRIDDVINCAGFKIFPKEVEGVLKEHASVFDCAVVGVADDVKGQIPKAWVVLRKDYQVTEKELIDFCRSQIANYKAPRDIVFIDEIPRSAIGKVDKKKLTA